MYPLKCIRVLAKTKLYIYASLMHLYIRSDAARNLVGGEIICVGSGWGQSNSRRSADSGRIISSIYAQLD